MLLDDMSRPIGAGGDTPLATWKMHGEDSAAAVSARKLGAALWRSVGQRLFGKLGIESCSSLPVHKLAMEQSKSIESCSEEWRRKKVHHHVKKLDEERVPQIMAEHHKMMKKLADSITHERKNCQNIDAANTKLLNDIARTKSSARRLSRGLERERKAKQQVEIMRDELARKVEWNKAEIATLRGLHARMEKERKVMQMAEAWKEDHVQEKLINARLIMECKYNQVNDLIMDVEAFLSPSTKDVITLMYKNRSTDQSKTKDSFMHKNQVKTSVHRYNPHVARAMKGHIEWAPGMKKHGGLAAGKLLEGKVERHRVVMKNVLKQRR